MGVFYIENAWTHVQVYNLHFSDTEDRNSQYHLGTRAKRGVNTMERILKENETAKVKNVAFIIKLLGKLQEDKQPNKVYLKLAQDEQFNILFDWEDALKIYYKSKSIGKTQTKHEVAENLCWSSLPFPEGSQGVGGNYSSQ